MELLSNSKNRIITTNKNVINVQPIKEDSKQSLAKIIGLINNLAKDESVKKAKLIDQSVAVKKLLAKSEYSAQDKTNLRKVFYDQFSDDDYNTEETFFSSYLEEMLKDPKNNRKSKIELNKEAREAALLAVIEDKKMQLNEFLNSDIETKSKISKAYKTFVECSSKKSKRCKNKSEPLKDEIDILLKNDIVQETNFISTESFDAIVDPRNDLANKIIDRKDAIEEIKRKKKERMETTLGVVETLNSNIKCVSELLKVSHQMLEQRLNKECDVSQADDSKFDNWTNLPGDNIDILFHTKNFTNKCIKGLKENTGNGSLMIQLTNIFNTLNNRIINLEKIVSAVANSVVSLGTIRMEEARIGEAGIKKIDDRLRLNSFLNKQGKQFYDVNDWNNLSAAQKIRERFTFKDYSLNPPIKQWKELTDKDKEAFIAEKQKFICTRISALYKAYNENPELHKTIVKYYDNLKFYYNRDSKGRVIDIPEDLYKSIPKPDDNWMKEKQFLEDKWIEASKNNTIFNSVYHEGIKFITNGLAAKDRFMEIRAKIDKLVENNKHKPNSKKIRRFKELNRIKGKYYGGIHNERKQYGNGNYDKNKHNNNKLKGMKRKGYNKYRKKYNKNRKKFKNINNINKNMEDNNTNNNENKIISSNAEKDSNSYYKNF